VEITIKKRGAFDGFLGLKGCSLRGWISIVELGFYCAVLLTPLPPRISIVVRIFLLLFLFCSFPPPFGSHQNRHSNPPPPDQPAAATARRAPRRALRATPVSLWGSPLTRFFSRGARSRPGDRATRRRPCGCDEFGHESCMFSFLFSDTAYNFALNIFLLWFFFSRLSGPLCGSA
jgi:hypothetical protein